MNVMEALTEMSCIVGGVLEENRKIIDIVGSLNDRVRKLEFEIDAMKKRQAEDDLK